MNKIFFRKIYDVLNFEFLKNVKLLFYILSRIFFTENEAMLVHFNFLKEIVLCELHFRTYNLLLKFFILNFTSYFLFTGLWLKIIFRSRRKLLSFGWSYSLPELQCKTSASFDVLHDHRTVASHNFLSIPCLHH